MIYLCPLSFRGSLLSLACSLLLTWVVPCSAAPDWSQYRGSDGSGISTDTIAVPDWSSGAQSIWKTATPNGFSSFTVAGDSLYTLIERSGQQVCVAMDALTGNEKWARPLNRSEYDGGGGAGAKGNKGGDGPRSTPVVSEGRVYVYDAMMKLTCLDASNGSVVWQHDIIGEFKGKNVQWQSAASPVIDGDLLFVAGGGAGQSLLAFNKNDGKVAWKMGSETMTHATPTVCQMHGKKQVVFIVKSGLISIDIKRGRKLWSFEYPWRTSTAASPVIDGNKVYVSAGYGVGAGLYSVSRTGKIKEVWRKPNRLMNHWSTPILHNGHLYGMFSFKKYGRGPLQCVELATGEVKWSQENYGPGNLIMVGDKLLALSDAGELAVIDATPKQYHELARAKVLGGKCWSTPAYSDGKVYIRSTTEAACISMK